MNYQAIAGHADHKNAQALANQATTDAYSCRLDDLAEATYDVSDAMVMCDTPQMRFWLDRENALEVGLLLVAAKQIVLAQCRTEIARKEAEQARREGVFHG